MNVKLTFPVSVDICNALDINEDTVLSVYFEKGEIVVEPMNNYDDLTCSEDFDDCEDCEYICPNCGHCTYNEEDC